MPYPLARLSKAQRENSRLTSYKTLRDVRSSAKKPRACLSFHQEIVNESVCSGLLTR